MRRNLPFWWLLLGVWFFVDWQLSEGVSQKWAALVRANFASTVLPDHTMTPGTIDSRVTQDNIKTTICKSGWTGTVRPSEHVTDRIKLKLLPLYHHSITSPLDYELDHLIPLELGGAPNDVKNLWPQPYVGTWGARKKDVLEKKLSRMVCSGTITLAKARNDISTDWITAYQQYVSTARVSHADKYTKRH